MDVVCLHCTHVFISIRVYRGHNDKRKRIEKMCDRAVILGLRREVMSKVEDGGWCDPLRRP